MTATIGRRRLEMTADRIEACCASHKIAARVWGGTVIRTHTALFTMTAAEATNPGKLLGLQDEFALALGLPVIVHACGPRLVRIRVFGL